MRIISGKYGGRKLTSFNLDHIRPTTDRVKESLFNIIQHDIEGSRVLDLYSGTGNLGIEAISRGAAFVHFVDADTRSVKLLKRNLEALEVTEPFKISRSEAIPYLLGKSKEDPYQLVLIDPPFPLTICKKTLEAVSDCDWVANSAKIVIEHYRREELEDQIKRLKCVDKRTYGDKHLRFYVKE